MRPMSDAVRRSESTGARSTGRAHLEAVGSVGGGGAPAARRSEPRLDALLAAAETLATRATSGADAGELASLAATTVADCADDVVLALCRVVARDTRLLELAPREALTAQLRLLVALAPIDEASLWVTAVDGRVHCAATVGDDQPSRSLRTAARKALRDPAEAAPTPTTITVSVRRFDRPAAALVGRAPRGSAELARAAAQEFATAVGPILERLALLEQGSERDRILSDTANRRLARLGFDIHDGPLQDVVALLADVRLYRGQLDRELPAGASHEPLLARTDDFEARLLGLVDDLRELAESFEPIGVLSRDLGDVLAREAETMRERSGIDVDLDVDVDAESLTASQRITIIRIVQEALANVRDHSGAKNVSVTALQEPGWVRVEIRDDGVGFELAPTLARARRQNRLGVAGMGERVRLLGGEFALESAPGAGTTISVVLPEWRPVGGSR